MKDLIETIKVKGIEVGTVLFKTFPEDSKEVTTEQLLTKACAYPELGFTRKQLLSGEWQVRIKKLNK